MSARWSALVVVALFADILATSALPAAEPGHSASAYWVTGILTACVFVLSVLAHELSHALTARHYGVPVRSVTLWLLGGMTEFDGEPRTPRAEAVIAAAGPAASIGLGAVSGLLSWVIGPNGLAPAALAWLAVVSVFVGVFNLLPGAPLDGGRVLHAAIWWRSGDGVRAGVIATRAGQLLGYALIALGIAGVLTVSTLGLWIALAGWTILVGASAERLTHQAQAWNGVHAAQVMTAPAAVFGDWWTVDRVLPQMNGQPDDTVLPLVDFDSLATGALTARELRQVPPDNLVDTRLRDLARARRTQPLVVPASAPMPFVAAALRDHGGIALVLDEQRYPVGIITAALLARRTAQAGPRQGPVGTPQTV
jgi:Zn-dependent protease